MQRSHPAYVTLGGGSPRCNTSVVQRGNDETIVEHRDPVIETTSKGLIARHALQRYIKDGVESKSKGADGDEFHSIGVWEDDTLVFDITESEGGKRLKLTEIWSLIGGGESEADAQD